MASLVVGLGAGGHAKVVIEVLQLRGDYEIAGLLDPDASLHGTRLLGVPVLGDDSLLGKLQGQGIRHAFIGLGGASDMRPRRRLYRMVRECGFEVVSAVHPRAIVSSNASLGYAATVMAGAIINSGARIGENVIVNTGAIVEHDCVIGDHVHVATGARLASSVVVGEGTHIGAGASVRQGIRIGCSVIVGMGAVVVKDVPDSVIVAGVPARILRTVDE